MLANRLINGHSNGREDSDREYGKRQTFLRSLNKFGDLRSFKVSALMHEAVLKKTVFELPAVRRIGLHLDENNYVSTLRTLLSIDEAHNAIAQRKYDKFEQEVISTFNTESGKKTELVSCKFKVDGLSNGQPKLIAKDIAIIKNANNDYKSFPIESIDGDFVLLDNETVLEDKEFLGGKLDIYLVSRGLIYDYYDRALDQFGNDASIKSRIFELGRTSQAGIKINLTPYNAINGLGTREQVETFNEKPIKLEERLAKLNGPQLQAVRGILANECWPKPFILFGPPGTGKTHTLVEAVAQIYVRSDARILFCANSNTCADQTIDKLKKIDLIATEDIVRLSAGQNADVIGFSRIVVTTNGKASSLMDNYSGIREETLSRAFSGMHMSVTNTKSSSSMGGYKFDYVFIDEAGHANEPESLLPICCLESNGCLVLAGDPKQLGPVVQCKPAAIKGLDKSMLDRIFEFEIYQKSTDTKKYNEKCITKLLVSYRCDERILAISNKLFYESELECPNSTPKSILKIMNLSTPLQFCHVYGKEFRPKNSTSWLNDEEGKLCVDLVTLLYKMGFEPDQIGVITPYKLQAKSITEKLNKQLNSAQINMLEKRFERRELVKRLKKKADKDDKDQKLASELEKLKFCEADEPAEDNQGRKNGDHGSDEDEYELVEEVVRRSDRWLCKIDTVDAFQGNERRIIIISTVRTDPTAKLDFICQSRRFNVALSRAKSLVFVLGHKDVLGKVTNWSEFMKNARSDTSSWPNQSFLAPEEDPFRPARALFK